METTSSPTRYATYCQFYESQYVKDYMAINKLYLSEHPVTKLVYVLPAFLAIILLFILHEQFLAANSGVSHDYLVTLKGYKSALASYRMDCVLVLLGCALLMFILYVMRNYYPVFVARKAYRELTNYKVIFDDYGVTKVTERGRGEYEKTFIDWRDMKHLWVNGLRLYMVSDIGERIIVHTPSLEDGSSGTAEQLRDFAKAKFEQAQSK